MIVAVIKSMKIPMQPRRKSLKRSKAVRFERDSKREQNGDANGNETKEDDEGKAVISFLLVRF